MRKIAIVTMTVFALAGCQPVMKLQADVAEAQCKAIGYQADTAEMRACMTAVITRAPSSTGSSTRFGYASTGQNLTMNAYGLGVHMDEYGRAVRTVPAF